MVALGAAPDNSRVKLPEMVKRHKDRLRKVKPLKVRALNHRVKLRKVRRSKVQLNRGLHRKVRLKAMRKLKLRRLHKPRPHPKLKPRPHRKLRRRLKQRQMLNKIEAMRNLLPRPKLKQTLVLKLRQRLKPKLRHKLKPRLRHKLKPMLPKRRLRLMLRRAPK